MTNAEPTPVFRRFPWVQLVFCIACLSMAAWTWMRYSYAWEVTPKELDDTPFQGDPTKVGSPSPRPDSRWLDGPSRELLKWTPPDWEHPFRHPLLGRYVSNHAEDAQAFSGRVVYKSRITRGGSTIEPYLAVDKSRSRFTGESIAGLIVGSMGVFIFSLYLRSWLGERTARASPPEQDMIA